MVELKNFGIPIIFAVFILFFCSCATLINKKTTSFTIITNQPTKLIVDNKDTLSTLSTEKKVTVNRSKKSLPVTVFNDSLTKKVKIKPVLSQVSVMNVLFAEFFLIGVIVDLTTKKGHDFPSKVYIDMNDTNKRYAKHNPLENPFNKFNNALKITPLKLIGTMYPSLELSYERRTGCSFSTQVSASYLFPESPLHYKEKFNPMNKGFRVSIGEKYYPTWSSFDGTYFGIDLNYLTIQYKDIKRFYNGNKQQNEDDFYWDSIRINKQTYCLNFKFGRQFIIKRKVVDIYAGIGLKYKTVKIFDRINYQDKERSHKSIFPDIINDKEGTYWGISIPLNFSVGWTF